MASRIRSWIVCFKILCPKVSISKLQRDIDYRNSNQTLLTFYTDHENSEIGRFDSIDQQIQGLHFTTVDDSLDLIQIQIQIDTILDQILSFDETFGEITELTSASELQDRSTLFHQLDSLFSSANC